MNTKLKPEKITIPPRELDSICRPITLHDGEVVAFQSENEQAFAVGAARDGWRITKRGWPDFLCIRGDELIAVEVKPDRTTPLTHAQLAVCRILKRHGIQVFRWSPDVGLENID